MTAIYALALLLGFVAGLRSFTAPAAVFLQRGGVAGYLFGVGAILEMIMDAMPRTAARTSVQGLTARIVSGIVVGWFFCSFHGANALLGALLSVVGALAGTFLGLRARLAAIARLGARSAALLEDFMAIGLAIFAVARG